MVIAEIAVGLVISAVVIGLLVMAMVWERRAGYYEKAAPAAVPVQAIPARQREEAPRAA
jgi:hypothetical protein